MKESHSITSLLGTSRWENRYILAIVLEYALCILPFPPPPYRLHSYSPSVHTAVIPSQLGGWMDGGEQRVERIIYHQILAFQWCVIYKFMKSQVSLPPSPLGPSSPVWLGRGVFFSIFYPVNCSFLFSFLSLFLFSPLTPRLAGRYQTVKQLTKKLSEEAGNYRIQPCRAKR